MKNLVILASLFALGVPAAFAAPPAGQGKQAATPSASQLCKQQRNTIGMAAFRALYAPTGTPKAAMNACLQAQKPIVGISAKNAAKECGVERDADEAAFNAKYGKNANDKNAYGKCVSMKTKENVTAQQQATLNAAKTCKAEKAQGAQAFSDKYGTNKNKRNAFGKCVSKLAKEQSG
jgi:DNA-directed RNA polymerase subunit M/transcription elongation factor TFIIS